MLFEAVRDLLVRTGLSPEPDTYQLFYLHLCGADPALSRRFVEMLDSGTLDRDAVSLLRREHLGEVARAELEALVKSAREGGERLSACLRDARARLVLHDKAIAAADREMPHAGGAQAIDRLRRSTALALKVHRRLHAEVELAMRGVARMLDRLETAERAATHDPLTGLANRRGTLRELAAEMVRVDSAGGSLSIGLVDLDHFAALNDRWGAAIGDEVLRCVGRHLASDGGDNGRRYFVGRIGGNRFLMLFPGLDARQACSVLDRARAGLVRQTIRRTADGASLGRVAFSAGVALCRVDDDSDSFVARAEIALAAAKNGGRDRVVPERAGVPA